MKKTRFFVVIYVLICSLMITNMPIAALGLSDSFQTGLATSSYEGTKTNSEFAGGNGTENNPYLISTPEQLNNVRNHLSSHFKQICDIDMSSISNWQPIGNARSLVSHYPFPEVPDEPFCGSYDGDGYNISNLSINNSSVSPADDCYGLFAALDECVIKNVNLVDLDYSINKATTDYAAVWNEYGGKSSVLVGGIAGNSLDDSEIINCTCSGSISLVNCNDAYVGGILGCGGLKAVSKCANYTDIYINANNPLSDDKDSSVLCGGIVGFVGESSSILSECLNKGNINIIAGEFLICGGITSMDCQIENCVNAGNIEGHVLESGLCYAGGIVGISDYIKRCVNYGNVCFDSNSTTATYAGGIVSCCFYDDSVAFCVNIGKTITAKNNQNTEALAGRIVGEKAAEAAEAAVNECFSLDSTIVNGSTVTGNSNDHNGESVSASELLTQAPYHGFDFDNIWTIDENMGGAVLKRYYVDQDDSAKTISGDFFYKSEITGGTESYRFTYDDSWFFNSSYAYQHNLARMSMRMAMAGAYTTPGYITDLYEKLGFKDYSIHYPTPTEDTIGYAIARKNIVKDGKSISVIAVTVRGGGYLDEWANNGLVGRGEEHEGFSNAATQIQYALLDYWFSNKTELNDDVKVWIVGYSRAAAVTNILAKRLISLDDLIHEYGINLDSDDIFAFCFECPMSTKAVDSHDDKYSNITCFVNPIDFIPMIPLSGWGYTRYGKTLYYPSRVHTNSYSNLKLAMLLHYSSILGDVSYMDDAYSYSLEAINQHQVFRDFCSQLCDVIPDTDKYVDYCQYNVIQFLKKFMTDGDSDPIQFMNAFNLLWNILGQSNKLNLTEFLVYAYSSKFTNSTGQSFLALAHFPELSLAWLDSMPESELKPAFDFTKLFVSNNTDETNVSMKSEPSLSIVVYNADEDIVAEFCNCSFSQLLDMEGNEYGICAYFDDNNQIVFCLPGDGEYRVEFSSSVETSLSVTMSKCAGENDTPEKLVSYFDVALSAGDTCTGIVDNINENESPYILLVNDKEIEPSADLNEGDQIEHLVNVQVEGCGRVYFPGTFVTGEYAKLEVVFNEENFLGWYLDGELLSTAPEYRIMVKDDLFITAKFSTKLGDVNLDGRIDLADTLLIMRYTLELIELEAPCDLDGDMSVSMADTLLSARYALGLI